MNELDSLVESATQLFAQSATPADLENAKAQFLGKSAKSALRVGDDINNISGATLSCTHLTDGIRRIAVMAQLALVKG